MKENNGHLSLLLIILGVLVIVSLACGSSSTTTAPSISTEISETNVITSAEETESWEAPTNTPLPMMTNTPRLTNTPQPSRTPLLPTATKNPNLIRPGTYIVGKDIMPGLYKGLAGDDVLSSCYWQRLKDLSGSLDSIIANDNAIGQFYIEIYSDDFALETDCDLFLLNSLTTPPPFGFPINIRPGTYLVGVDILPGPYLGHAGEDVLNSCYWERLRDFSGSISSIISNDNSIGQFYVQVNENDYALKTACDLERIGD